MTVKVVPKAVCDPEIFSESRPYVHWRKWNIEREGKLEQFDAAFGTIFRRSKCFLRSKDKY